MALFCDFENVALGVRDARLDKFDISQVTERLLSRGTIVVKKAYADWERYRDYKKVMHRANFELIEVPILSASGKNSADIRMVVDALDLCYTKEHVSTFVLISGDSDFSPLVSKLRENNKTVIGIGVRNSTSELLVSNCDEFLFYDDLVASSPRARSEGRNARGRTAPEGKSEKAKEEPKPRAARGAAPSGSRAKAVEPAPPSSPAAAVPKAVRNKDKDASDPAVDALAAPPPSEVQALDMLMETIEDMFADRADTDTVWASMLKQSVKRRRPDFSEKLYGYRTFGQMLEAARDHGLIEIEKDESSGNYRILGFGPNG